MTMGRPSTASDVGCEHPLNTPRPGIYPASHWLRLASGSSAQLVRVLRATYGAASDVTDRRLGRIVALAETYIDRFGDTPVVVARAPGRVNLLGRHIDHQGGHCNMLAIERDLYVMVGLRHDTRIRMVNVEPSRFGEAASDINEVLPGYVGGAWRSYVDSPAVREQATRDAGQWQQYVKASVARFMAARPELAWTGMNVVAAGDVPVAAGLSSSSALVVAVAEALAALYGLDLAPEDFAETCGEAEWYVGARGGSGDQAAMKFAQAGCVVQIEFHPMRVVQVAPWPPEYALLVCNSGVEARKSAGARNTFNQRVAGCHIAREMVRRTHPELADRVSHLRDLTPHRLGVSDAEAAQNLLAIPERMRRSEILQSLGESVAEPLLASHTWDTGFYALRAIAAFGLAECERSRLCAELLHDGDIGEVGRLMCVSHDGDRVTASADGVFGQEGKGYGDAAVRDLIEKCRMGMRLADEPGAYACSTPDIDLMVDTSLSVPGVIGAQLSGAGLGGCMMVLAEVSAIPSVIAALERHYYAPRRRQPDIHVCRPVAGSGTLAP